MERLFKRTETENNEIAAKIFLGLAVFILAVMLLCWFGIFVFSIRAVTLFAGISILTLLIPVILINVFHLNNTYTKYILISIISFILGLCYCIFTFQMVILFLIPSLVSMLYMNRKLLYFSGILNLFIITGAHIATNFLMLQPRLEPFTGLTEIIRFGVIPRIMQLMVCFYILVIVMNRMLSYMQQIQKLNMERISEFSSSEKIFDSDKQKFDSYLKKLNEREKDVFLQMLLGKTNTQIAESLYLSTGTVKNYVSSIYDKIGTKERNYLILKFGRFVTNYDQSNSTL